MSQWISVLDSAILASRTEPYFVDRASVDRLVELFVEGGGTVVEVDISASATTYDLVTALRQVLPFPDWCGSNWDAMEDAFTELSGAWPFPVCLLMVGAPVLLERNPHLAFECALRLASFADAFGLGGKQFLVVYLWSHQARP